MTYDRRDAPRTPALLHAQIETDSGRSTIAVTQDVSATGLLVLSHQAIGLGRHVTIHVLVDGNQYEVSGKVVRVEELAHGEASIWRSKEAVSIDKKQQPDLAKILAAIGS